MLPVHLVVASNFLPLFVSGLSCLPLRLRLDEHSTKKWRQLGIIVLAMPALFQPDSVAMYFSALGVPHDATRNIVLTMSILGLLSLTALLIDFRQISLELITWLVVLSLTSYALPVLYYFCVYFCGLHGPLHTLDIKRRYRLSWYF